MTNKRLNLRKLIAGTAICLVASATTFAQIDVYVGGEDNGKATVWKNGTPEYYADGGINSVVANNGDVYAIGSESGFGYKVWKNGVEEPYAPDADVISSIVVSESGNVYVAGQEWGLERDFGRLWKNGVIESGYADAYSLTSIFINGTDIYAAGRTDNRVAAIWKNGTLLYTLTSGGKDDDVLSIFVYGGDVYSTGWEFDDVKNIYLFKVWKNDAAIYTTEDAWAYGIYISEGVVYATGAQHNGSEYVATLWTNGVATELAGGSEGYSVFVSGSDVYVAGIGGNDALLWVNGTATTLATDGGSAAYSVFVVKEKYTVSFAGETIDIKPQIIEHGNKVTRPPDPERTGYKFGGWFTDNGTFLNEWNFETNVVTQDIKLWAKWTVITGISEIERADIKIYPNPVKDELRIEIGELRINRVEIVDFSGKTIYWFNSSRNEINVSALPSGIYFVKLETDKGIITQKFVKE